MVDKLEAMCAKSDAAVTHAISGNNVRRVWLPGSLAFTLGQNLRAAEVLLGQGRRGHSGTTDQPHRRSVEVEHS